MSTGIFDYDSPFGQLMGRLWDLLVLNILCLLCCIPVVTVGASVTALHYVTLKMAENRGSKIYRSFWKAFKENLGQAVILELALLAVLALIRLGFIFLLSEHAVSAAPVPIRFILFFILLAVLILTAAAALYVFAVQARFINTPGRTAKNALLMAISHLHVTAAMLLLDGAFYYITFRYMTWLAFWLVSGPVYLNSLFLCRVFKKYMPEEKEGL